MPEQFQRIPEEEGGGDVPLLAEDDPARIITPERLPVGKRDAMWRRMFHGFVYTTKNQPAHDDVPLRRTPVAEKAPQGPEHGILIYDLRVLGD